LPTIAQMTTYSHNMAMKKVGIADLKSRLSEYLRAVRRGETIAVLDRQTPVAQIVPVPRQVPLRVREPAPEAPAPNEIPLPKPLNLKVDIVQLLLKERQVLR
jgi:prevent-host-death family protein